MERRGSIHSYHSCNKPSLRWTYILGTIHLGWFGRVGIDGLVPAPVLGLDGDLC